MNAWTVETRTAAVDAILLRAPILPVLAIDKLEHAVPLAKALVAGGLPVLEITLRTPIALEVIATLVKECPEAVIGAGTVLGPEDLEAVVNAGAAFAIAPGCTRRLYAAAAACPIPFIPAVATASEVMEGMDQGHRRFKFFPAVPMGGVSTLKSFAGPFAQAKFCPTGGISAETAPQFLALANVITVGGSWMAPSPLVLRGEWASVEKAARASSALRAA
jgi:2-dehydro-3-deoxyphosphogluconate aldolase/(4S)-4-hydroxy-2-oxoglutarate aldolase